jgi:hypothetical protein
LRLRSRQEVARFFDGFELTGPGLVSGTQWLETVPGTEDQPAGASFGYNAAARNP